MDLRHLNPNLNKTNRERVTKKWITQGSHSKSENYLFLVWRQGLSMTPVELSWKILSLPCSHGWLVEIISDISPNLTVMPLITSCPLLSQCNISTVGPISKQPFSSRVTIESWCNIMQSLCLLLVGVLVNCSIKFLQELCVNYAVSVL